MIEWHVQMTRRHLRLATLSKFLTTHREDLEIRGQIKMQITYNG
ncbi:hypothetical protein AVEN_170149-1, partial [Araneus ventricosus]